VLRLPDDLARVGALLDDPVFFAPFAPYFHPALGRPSSSSISRTRSRSATGPVLTISTPAETSAARP
jgi:hypothetical protein